MKLDKPIYHVAATCKHVSICPDSLIHRHVQVCFGRILDEGLLVLRKLENVQVNAQNSKPKIDCRISQCGEM